MARKRETRSSQGGKYTLMKFAQLPSECRQAYVIGWQNVMDGEDYHPAYDTLTEKMQLNYENGRLDATNVLALLARDDIRQKYGVIQPPPFWRKITDQPQEIKNLIGWAHHLIGDPRPARHI